MTPSPESRSEKLVEALRDCEDRHGTFDWGAGEALIAAAIREAENDKLEEAAAILDEYRTNEASDYSAGQDVAAKEAAAEIRSLKHKD